jgi:hypothetical protein
MTPGSELDSDDDVKEWRNKQSVQIRSYFNTAENKILKLANWLR